jgi:hypothetical protein
MTDQRTVRFREAVDCQEMKCPEFQEKSTVGCHSRLRDEFVPIDDRPDLCCIICPLCRRSEPSCRCGLLLSVRYPEGSLFPEAHYPELVLSLGKECQRIGCTLREICCNDCLAQGLLAASISKSFDSSARTILICPLTMRERRRR